MQHKKSHGCTHTSVKRATAGDGDGNGGLCVLYISKMVKLDTMSVYSGTKTTNQTNKHRLVCSRRERKKESYAGIQIEIVKLLFSITI